MKESRVSVKKQKMQTHKAMSITTLLFFMIVIVFSSSAQAVTLKIATLSPDGSYWMKTLRSAAAEVKDKTNGRVKFKFYPGGVMGDDKAVLRKMRIGQLHGGVFTANAVVPFYKDIQVYNLLDAFHNKEEVSYVRSRMDAQMKEGLEKGGIVAMGMAEIGFAYIMSTKPVKSVSDVRRSKAWVPDNDSAAMEAIKAFGIAPIPLPFGDVLLGLQTGMVETVGASPVAAIALQWHTQIKYIIDIPLLYIFGVFAIDEKKFNKIDEKDRQLVRDIMGKAADAIDRQNREDNEKAFEALIGTGVELIKPVKSDRDEFRRVSTIANESQITKGNVTREIYDQFFRELSAAREQ